MSFQITVQPSGRSFQAEVGEGVLAAGIRQGIGLPYGCKDGACGSCKCKKLLGEVTHGTHSDKALSAEEEADLDKGAVAAFERFTVLLEHAYAAQPELA